MAEKKRLASHAGSWYTDDGAKLNKQLGNWLEKANLLDSNARGIICPHAGYSYSGPTAAWSFKNMDKNKIKRIFVLGPSHHVYLTKCALSMMSEYETPIGNITLDTSSTFSSFNNASAIQELHSTGQFEWMKKSVDEAEHSIEMQLPYIEKMMQGASYKLVPVMVGSVNKESENMYGKIFAKYLEDESNFFVISSDFCHWGSRFDYQYYEPEHGPIFKSIEVLDKRGMEIIASQDVEKFYAYQKKYKNTICGRHPIGVFLQALSQAKDKFKLQFVQYAQSSQCQSMGDSSVSYAAAVVTKL